MSIDYGERERQFLETLAADSGRTLEQWMAAITAEGLTHRNDIIDWLRRQGFIFSKASWLERIHNNGGRPIYDGRASTRRPQPRPQQPAAPAPRPQLTLVVQNPPPAVPVAAVVRPVDPAPVEKAPEPPPAPPAISRPPASPPEAKPAPASVPMPASNTASSDQSAIDALLVRAKAFRPLAAFVTAEIRKQIPGVAVIVRDGYLEFATATASFAVLAISPKELKLGLSLKSAPSGAPLEAAKLTGLRGAPPVSHMAILTDARQITPALLSAIAQSASGA